MDEAGGLELGTRAGLPEALRVLVAEMPRQGWEAHPGFHGLVSFWLERHLSFRRLMDAMEGEARAMLDRRLDPERFARGLSRMGGAFLEQLHGHHQIEDHQYFPQLRRIEARLERGFDLLDADHHALDAILGRFAAAANGAIRGVQAGNGGPGAEAFRKELVALQRLIDRHLTDEEDLIVPVILRHGDRLPG